MPRSAWTYALIPAVLFACGAPDRTVDLYADPVSVDLGSLPVDGGVVTFEVTVANTGTGDGSITSLELVGDDLTYVALQPALPLPSYVAAGDVARVPVTVTNLDELPEGWLEQQLSLDVTIESEWATGGCNGAAPATDTLSIPITFAVPDGCDADDDGFRSALCGGDDCDDTNAESYPGATERCDFEDNDCDGEVDNGAIDASPWYADADADGFGAGSAEFGCVAPGPDWVDNDEDCDDTAAAVNPDATEVCNDIDDDCDADIDDDDNSVDLSTGSSYWADRDGDTYGNASDRVQACEAPVGYTDRARDCDDTRTFVNPEGTETCDGTLDEDCDGDVDEGGATDASIWYADRDGDTYGTSSDQRSACTQPTGYVARAGDCDDTLSTKYPDSPELCNGVSDDCDNRVDEGAGDTYYADRDNDFFGDDDDSFVSCDPVTGYVTTPGDCNDQSFRYNPDAPEPCDEFEDYNCDGVAGDGVCNTCLDLLAAQTATSDGVYGLDVDLDGDSTPDTTIQTYCDMTTDGGGWTLVQRTVWEWAESSQLYTNYDDWLLLELGDANPGTAYRAPGAYWPAAGALGDMLVVHRVRTELGGACEPLYYEGSNGVLTVDATGGTATLTGLTASVALASEQLSTTDSGPSQNCVGFNAVPWFYGACCATCPTYQGGYWGEPHPMVSYASVSPDIAGRTTSDACATTPQGPANGTVYLGVDSMEIYLR